LLLTQLPLGSALDRYGPRRVMLVLLVAAVLGCVAFASAHNFAGLTAARALIGAGVSACLMAPMTAFRRRFSAVAQMRANSWMLMTGSLGMVASTLPVQWLLPIVGWRGLFWLVAAALAFAALAIAWKSVGLQPDHLRRRFSFCNGESASPSTLCARPAGTSCRRIGGLLRCWGDAVRWPTCVFVADDRTADAKLNFTSRTAD
jgi:MFS family permease